MSHTPHGFVSVEIAHVSSSALGKGTSAPMWEPYIVTSDDGQDNLNLGPSPVFQSLGVSSMPYPADDTGQVETVVLRHCGGRNAVCIGARDTRTSGAIGKMGPGDTILHSTGPAQASQVHCKEEKRQVVAFTKTLNGQSVLFVLDGVNDRIQLTKGGAIIQIDKDNNMALLNGQGFGFLIQGSNIFVNGNLVPGKGNPPGMAVMLGPITGSPGGAGSVPLVAMKGVSPGS